MVEKTSKVGLALPPTKYNVYISHTIRAFWLTYVQNILVYIFDPTFDSVQPNLARRLTCEDQSREKYLMYNDIKHTLPISLR